MPRLLAIECTDVEVRLAVATSRGDQMVVEQAFSSPLEPKSDGARFPAELGAKIAAVLDEAGVGRPEVLVSIGRANIELRQLTVPPAPDDELPDLVRFQAMREFTGLQEDWPLDYLPLDEAGEQQRRVLAAAIDPALVKQIQDTYQAAGLKPRRLLLRPCGAASLLERRSEAATRARLLVDVLGDEADLTVLTSPAEPAGSPAGPPGPGRSKVVFLRTTRLPGDPLTSPEPAQALLGEIRRTIAAAHNQLANGGVEAIVLCGRGPRQTALAEWLAQQLGKPVELFDPFAGLQVEGVLQRQLPERPGRFAPLLGMLWDDLTGAPPAFDFLHPRRRPPPPSRRRLYVRAALVAALVLVLVGGLVWLEYQALDEQMLDFDRQEQEADAVLKKGKRTEDTKAELDKWLAGEVIWLDELYWLSQNMPPAKEVMIFEFIGSSGQRGDVRGGEMALKGRARSVDTVTAMEQKLSDKTHQMLGKETIEDRSHKTYSLRFNSTVRIGAEARQ